MSSHNKEREILERQRLLAARLKPPATTAATGTTETKSQAKSVVSSSSGASTSSIHRSSSKSTKSDGTTTKPSTVPPTRPSLKRPATAKSSSAILAAARAKAGSSVDTAAVKPPPPSAPRPPKTNGDSKPSPRVQRKTLNPAQAPSSMLAGNSSLASLIKHVAKTDDNDAMEQSLQTHKPDDFWKNLREWDLPSQYYRETRLQQQQLESKEAGDSTMNAASTTTRKPIPDTFLNSRHYVAAWAPLCMAECRSQLLQEVTQSMTSPILVEVQATGSRIRHRRDHGAGDDAPWMEDNETGGHVIVHTKKRENVRFFANDIVLLLQTRYKDILNDIGNGRAVPPDGSDPDSSSVFASISLVGHTESSRNELNGLILKVSKRKWTVIGQKEMYLVKVGSNVTALREFTALCNVDTLPMKRFLLGQHLEKAENRRKLSRNQPIDQLLHQMGGEQLGEGFLNYAKTKFNPSQLTAIAASAHEYGEGGFTLIKGPPGTGKTTTLVAVLNSLHIRQFNKYYSEVRRIATKATGSREADLQIARRSKPRLLVCAPSNAAIDNIIMKIMEDGFIDGQGRRYNPSMIRVGIGQSNMVRDVSLENRVDAIFAENDDVQQIQASIAGYRAELSHISGDIARLRRRAHAIQQAAPYPLSSDWEIRIDEDSFEKTGKAFFVNHQHQVTTYELPPPPEPGQTQFKSTSMPEYREYLSRIVKLVESYFNMKTNLERCTLVKASMEAGADQFDVRLNLESHVLNSVHMVMTTLGSAGNRTLESAERFEVIVVDEAAQSVEPASLAALRLGSRHAVLVGDPQQLPATIFNVSGRNSKYDRSLFQRLEEAGQPTYMLNEQYRMHPKISHFPRHIFYKGELLDGPNVSDAAYGNPLRDVICRAAPQLSPLTILDLDSQEERGGTSLSNLSEAKLAVYLYDQLKALSHGLSASSKVAVITPYAQQCKLLRQSFSNLLGPNYENSVEVNTVDAFQGREANIVIFSAVRAAGSRGIGFLSDVRRMNVALTRAKHFLFVIARCESIVVNPYWFDFVQHARETGSVVRVPMVGYGATASFSILTSWKKESVVGDSEELVAYSNSLNLPRDDPRKRQRA